MVKNPTKNWLSPSTSRLNKRKSFKTITVLSMSELHLSDS